MAPEYNASQSLPVERSLAMQITEAYRVEQSGPSARTGDEKHSSKRTTDSASIVSNSSFGSTVGLLKSKFRSKHTVDADKKRQEDMRETLRNQVNIVG